ncbi:MAG: hypothetical protein GY940_27490, partial [bacterium]|nr:hypothetical protein [bacterium]
MNLEKWFNNTVWTKVLKILSELGAQFKDAGGNADWRKAVTVLSDFFNNQLQPPLDKVVGTVIKGLKLSEEVDSLRAFWQKIPDPVRQILTTPLKDFQSPVNWPALGPEGKGVSYGNLAGPLNSLIGFNATGNLVLALEAMDTVTVLGQPAGV